MDPTMLHFVVLAQIVVFQFVAVAFTRSLFSALLSQPDGSIPAGSATYLRGVRRFRFTLGGALFLVGIAALFGLPADPGVQKPVLLVVSLLSSAAFVQASVQDRRALRRMRAALPDSGVRRASLQPRHIEDWYSAAWEALPIVIFLATVIVAVVLGQRIGTVTTGMWMLLVIQFAFVVGSLVYTLRGNIGVPDVSRHLRGVVVPPEKSLALGERLVGLEMRAFMAAKVSVALLLGVGLVEKGLSRLGADAASWFAVASWGLVALLLLLFTGFVARLMVLVRSVR